MAQHCAGRCRSAHRPVRPYTRRRDRPRLPSLARSGPARRGRGARLHDPRRGRPRVPRRGGRRDRRQRRPRAGVDRPGPRGAARPPRVRPRLGVHDRAARGLRRGDRAAAAGRRPGDLPGQRRLRGDRDGAEARPGVPPRPRRAGRWIVVIARWGSYHGNTLGALDLSGRRAAPPAVRGLARAGSGTSPRPIRTGPASPAAHALGVRRRARGRARAGDRGGRARARSPRSSPSRSSGRRSRPPSRRTTTGRAIAEVCRRHGVLLIADEVMTGFGRTGRWFGLDHWGVRADILVAAKGATSRLLAVRVRRGVRRDPRRGHRAPAGSSTASPTRTRRAAPPSPARSSGSSTRRTWSRRAGSKGERLADLLHERLAPHPHLGEIRGRGLMVGAGARRATARRARPFPRADRAHGARSSGRPATRACSSTRARATRTASTATRSCSARRSSSRTRAGADRGRRCRRDRDGDGARSAAPAEAPRLSAAPVSSGSTPEQQQGADRDEDQRPGDPRQSRAGGSPTARSRAGSRRTAPASRSRRRATRGPRR